MFGSSDSNQGNGDSVSTKAPLISPRKSPPSDSPAPSSSVGPSADGAANAGPGGDNSSAQANGRGPRPHHRRRPRHKRGRGRNPRAPLHPSESPSNGSVDPFSSSERSTQDAPRSIFPIADPLESVSHDSATPAILVDAGSSSGGEASPNGHLHPSERRNSRRRRGRNRWRNKKRDRQHPQNPSAPDSESPEGYPEGASSEHDSIASMGAEGASMDSSPNNQNLVFQRPRHPSETSAAGTDGTTGSSAQGNGRRGKKHSRRGRRGRQGREHHPSGGTASGPHAGGTLGQHSAPSIGKTYTAGLPSKPERVSNALLSYQKIKTEFKRSTWGRGEQYNREKRVAEVKRAGPLISAKIRGSEATPYETALFAMDGAIFNSKCSCPVHRAHEQHCKHVAALAAWVLKHNEELQAMDTASTQKAVHPEDTDLMIKEYDAAVQDPRIRILLNTHKQLKGATIRIRRDRLAGSVEGRSEEGALISIPITLVEAEALLNYTDVASKVSNRPSLVLGEPVLYVRGSFQGKLFTSLKVESALRFVDPIHHTPQVVTLSYLTREPHPGLWKTSLGQLVHIPAAESEIDEIGNRVLPKNWDGEAQLIHNLSVPEQLYEGAAAVDQLGRLLEHKWRDRIVLEKPVHMPIAPEPLRMKSIHIGARGSNQQRSLTYQFHSGENEFSSQDLDDLTQIGRVGTQYIWKDDYLYRFETPLNRLSSYVTRGEQGPRAKTRESIADTTDQPLHPLTAYRLILEMGAENFTVDPDWKEFNTWRDTFEKTKLPALPRISYGFDLREYQKNGLSWLWSLYHRGLSAMLADDMGLGKTHQGLAFLSSLYKSKTHKPDLPSLVVAPNSVIAAWEQKLNKYNTGMKWVVFHGKARELPTKNSTTHLVLTTYGILNREPKLLERNWHVVILDEAQTIKNAETQSSLNARKLKAEFRIAMTGTPVENQATDLWALVEFMLPGYLGNLTRFKSLYGASSKDFTPGFETAALKRLITPFMLRRTKAKVLTELPEKSEEVVACAMTEPQKLAYKEMMNSASAVQVREALEEGGKIDYANVLALLTRLKQICDHPRLAELNTGATSPEELDPFQSGKWETFDELMQEALGSGLKVVVFTQYLGMMDLVGTYLKKRGIGSTELRGDTQDRGARLKEFAENPECKVFVCSLLAGGLGIDLTAASVCIHMDRWWNPARENQATDRLHRFGQTRGVQVFKLQLEGTVEDRVAAIIEKKTALSGALVEESSLGLKSFSRKELLELLAMPTEK